MLFKLVENETDTNVIEFEKHIAPVETKKNPDKHQHLPEYRRSPHHFCLCDRCDEQILSSYLHCDCDYDICDKCMKTDFTDKIRGKEDLKEEKKKEETLKEEKKEEKKKEEETKKKKQSIPKNVRIIVWNHYIGEDIIKHKCLCCKKVTISNTNFEVGHVQSEKNGGTHEINNLRPICYSCNHSMATENMIDFVVKYGLYIG
jgi:hypothetical protein